MSGFCYSYVIRVQSPYTTDRLRDVFAARPLDIPLLPRYTLISTIPKPRPEYPGMTKGILSEWREFHLGRRVSCLNFITSAATLPARA